MRGEIEMTWLLYTGQQLFRKQAVFHLRPSLLLCDSHQRQLWYVQVLSTNKERIRKMESYQRQLVDLFKSALFIQLKHFMVSTALGIANSIRVTRCSLDLKYPPTARWWDC